MYIRLPQFREMNKRKNTNIALHTYARHLASYRFIRGRQESERRSAKMKLALSFMLLYAWLVCVTPYKIQKVRHKKHKTTKATQDFFSPVRNRRKGHYTNLIFAIPVKFTALLVTDISHRYYLNWISF